MTAVLSIKGEKYRSIDDVEKAVRKLAADVMLLPEDSAERNAAVEHVGLLLDAIPDERASAMLELIAGVPVVNVDELDAAEPDETRRVETHRSVADEIEDAPLCPMCQGHGVLGAEPPQDPTAERCPACDGYGTVYTGSRVEGHTTRHCPTCAGNGYIGKTSETPLPPPVRRAAAAPEWPNAIWNPTAQLWDAPPDAAPWENARWNGMEGKYE